MKKTRRLIVGISGASGTIYGLRALEALRETDVETHLVMTKSAEITLTYEAGGKVSDVHALADIVHPIGDIGASISSGSFKTIGMLVAPCSIRSLSGIVSGVTDNLLIRAADVVLKERRRLVLLVRETPLHLGHLRSMTAASEMGAVVMPPVPAFYHKPQTIEDIVAQTVGRALDMFEIDAGTVKRWGEPAAEGGIEAPVRRFRARPAEPTPIAEAAPESEPVITAESQITASPDFHPERIWQRELEQWRTERAASRQPMAAAAGEDWDEQRWWRREMAERSDGSAKRERPEPAVAPKSAPSKSDDQRRSAAKATIRTGPKPQPPQSSAIEDDEGFFGRDS
jgi:4-hydroxy-3-polyprenylbenzoate decarboxylase